jgi:hypothetical protein
MLRDWKITRHAAAALLACLAAGPVYAGTCTSPAGKEGDIKYNNDFHTYQFCNGTSWIAFGPGGCFAPQSGAYQPTIPNDSGYFVLTSTTWNGVLGDLAGADAKCLTEIGTTYTGWMGYSAANSNGQLISSKVHAFLCDASACNTLMPVTTYYFANAGNSSAGGASFTTDINGIGPNDSADWSAANYFSGTYTYWTDNLGSTSTAWGTAALGGGSSGGCYGNGWNNSAAYLGYTGMSGYTNASRWTEGSAPTCDNSYHLICFVNP